MPESEVRDRVVGRKIVTERHGVVMVGDFKATVQAGATALSNQRAGQFLIVQPGEEEKLADLLLAAAELRRTKLDGQGFGEPAAREPGRAGGVRGEHFTHVTTDEASSA